MRYLAGCSYEFRKRGWIKMHMSKQYDALEEHLLHFLNIHKKIRCRLHVECVWRSKGIDATIRWISNASSKRKISLAQKR